MKMNKITILALSLLAIGSAQGMTTKKGRQIMACQMAQRAALAATPANRAKIVLVPVSKPAPACSKEEYYNVRLPLINAVKEAKNKIKSIAVSTAKKEAVKLDHIKFINGDVSHVYEFIKESPVALNTQSPALPALASRSALKTTKKDNALVAPKPQAVVQQRTALGKTVATLAPIAALGTLIAYDQGLLTNAALTNAVQSIDVARFAAFFKNSILNPAFNNAQWALRYANPALNYVTQYAKENAEYIPVPTLAAYIVAKNHTKMKKEACELAAEERGYASLGQRAAQANELYITGKTPYNPKNLEVKVVGIKREGNTFVLDDKH